MRGRLIAASFASFLFLQCTSDASSSPTPRFSWAVSDHNEKVALKYLWWSLKNDHKGGHFYYSVPDCDGVASNFPFPEILIRPPKKNIADVTTIRRIFAEDKNINVSDSNGIIRIRYGSIPMAILQTKIARIRLSPESQYNPELAVLAIEHASEVQARMSELGVHTLELPFDMIITSPAPGLVHLPPEMKQITMDEALDVVARTFNGLVQTAYCRKYRLMDNSFSGGIYFDDHSVDDVK